MTTSASDAWLEAADEPDAEDGAVIGFGSLPLEHAASPASAPIAIHRRVRRPIADESGQGTALPSLPLTQLRTSATSKARRVPADFSGSVRSRTRNSRPARER